MSRETLAATRTPNRAMTVPAGWLLAPALALAGYASPIASTAAIEWPHWAVGLALVSGASSWWATRFDSEHSWAWVAPLLDGSTFMAAVSVAAVRSAPGFGVGVAVAACLWAATRRPSALPRGAALAMLIPPVLCCLAWPPQPGVALTLVGASLVAALVCLWRPAGVVATTTSQKSLPSCVQQSAPAREPSSSIPLNASLLDLGRFLHELRNAQSAIRLNLSYLKSAEGLDRESTEALRDALNGQEHSEEIMARAADQLRSNVGAKGEGFELLEVVETAAAEARSYLRAEIRHPGQPCRARGRADRMAAVLRSLFRNSAQAGAGHVMISIEPGDDAGTVELAVEDDGSGLSPEVLSHLSMPFDGTRQTGDAAGLGLYLVRTYVAVVGGSVEANNRPEGGARFLLRLPLDGFSSAT